MPINGYRSYPIPMLLCNWPLSIPGSPKVLMIRNMWTHTVGIENFPTMSWVKKTGFPRLRSGLPPNAVFRNGQLKPWPESLPLRSPLLSLLWRRLILGVPTPVNQPDWNASCWGCRVWASRAFTKCQIVGAECPEASYSPKASACA